MTDPTSIGYGGTITEDNWADIAPHLGFEYGVSNAASWQVTTVPASTRTVAVAPGTGWGRGVVDTLAAAVQLTHDIVSTSGAFRYDLIVAHRDWSGTGGTTTFTIVKGTVLNDDGTSALNARSKRTGPGTTDDQPIALVRIDYNQTVPSDVKDLRIWQSNSGAIADATNGQYVLQYLTAPGSEVIIGTDRWLLLTDGTWRRTPLLNPVNLLAAGASLAGGTPPAGAPTYMQAGTPSVTTNSNGDFTVVFPVPFPNGLLSVPLALISGSASTAPGPYLVDLFPATAGIHATRTGFSGRAFTAAGGVPVPSGLFGVSYIAIGW